MVARRGASRLGCLFTLLMFVAIGYFGVNVGRPYFRYYQFKDAITQIAKFASQHSDDQIRLRLSSLADTLNLPVEARRINVRRQNNVINIWTEYTEHVEFPGYVKSIEFRPQASSRY